MDIQPQIKLIFKVHIFNMSISIQLFYQPSLTASYLRNNRFMSAYDFTLTFPSVPLSFGFSSDLAAGWSKLVYEQVLMNKTQ